MRLCNIKLSGFKSFVDPSNLIVSGRLVGIVGPNGCGKSNIIDAVTWVMGESSAKHLRGDSLTDVIFSGSSARQPVGQASVELVFDNAEKKLGGQYASYNEISIKRQINRDGISTYYLNGTRCRRRDITTIFLGTGLGPRSYAIIEQGMISRLIEAKPEEFRVFIEEAAGISKYRERRRETENRIKHTRENIERLNDIREELDKQLNHLQQQSRAAERYKRLKEEERKLNSELLALNWRDLNKEMVSLKADAGKRENAVEASIAKVRETEAETEKLREGLSEANQHFNNMQSEYYKVGSDISQYEQKLQHTHEKITAIEADLEKTVLSCNESLKQHGQDKAEYEKLQIELNNLEPKLQGSRSESNKAYEFLNHAEEAMHGWQAEWDAFNKAFSEFTRQEQIDKTRLEHLEFGLDETAEKNIKLKTEIEKLEKSDLAGTVHNLTVALDEKDTNHTALTKEYEQQRAIVKEYRDNLKTLSSRLDSARQDYQSLKGRLVSLETLQQSIVEDTQELTDWLKENGLDKNQRLSQLIKIDPNWTHALETVTESYLHNICVDKLDDYLDKLGNAPGKFGLISTPVFDDNKPLKNHPRLIDKLSTNVCIPYLLKTIYIAASIDEALGILVDLSEGESVVTQSGIWLSHNWVIINNLTEAKEGVLGREQEIRELKVETETVTNQIVSLETELKLAEENREEAEALLNSQQKSLNEQQQKTSDIRAKLASAQTESKQLTIKLQQLAEELEFNTEQQQSDKAEMTSIKQQLSQLEKDKTILEEQGNDLTKVREQHRDSLNNARVRWQSTHEESHSIALQLESFSSRKASCEQAIKRNDIQVLHLQGRKTELEKSLDENKSPLEEIQENIEACLRDKILAEKNLTDARTQVQAIESKMREREQGRHKFEQTLDGLRVDLEKSRLGVNSCQVKLETVEEQLIVLEQTVEQLLSGLDVDTKQEDWVSQLESMVRRIQRLGPINLAAIDEYSQGAERKTYLDSQHKDLMEALTTLENAIRKIDKETRTRFKETFDALNTNIKDMFPKLFGGGHAYLELTGDDLLQTGVAIMARPPGKKNSNIHLLSGGEKALTAVALVFAIFKLNPAPFCILDEVDAPLDDTNVGRFSDLLKSMADEIQFIFITHNKITMEIAHQLLGVTMHEAGVSRLVSVDVDEAVEMTATA